jgi:hypothetical protein
MSITQIGYTGSVGPAFVDNSTVTGKKIFLQGMTQPNGTVGIFAKEPEYAANLGLTASEFTLGPYTGNQRVGDIPAFVAPSNTNFSGFNTDLAGMAASTSVPGGGSTSGGSTTGGTSTTGGSSSTGGGSTSGGTVTTTDNTFKAPTVMEQFTTFFSNYWWLLLIVVGFLLWKPLIAPALGMGGSKRKRR